MSDDGIPDMAEGLAKLYREELEDSLNRMVHTASLCHYGCDGKCPPPPPPPRRVRAWRWVRTWLWLRPWAAVHRILPGECRCVECEEHECW